MILYARWGRARLCPLLLCLALSFLASARVAAAQSTALYFDSQPGDYVGQGQRRTLTLADATFAVQALDVNSVRVTLTMPHIPHHWVLVLAAPSQVPLVLGSYEAARTHATAENPSLDFYGEGRGCNRVTGRYVIRELIVGSGGTVTSLAADFEQHCEDGNAGLFGAIRYNSSIADLRPFEGNYPTYQLTIAPPQHGRITGGGIDCGSGAAVCSVTYPVPTLVTLTATPDPGYGFNRWTGECGEDVTGIIRVNQRRQCGVLLDDQFDGTSQLFLDSQPGDYIGRGERRTFWPTSAIFSVFKNFRNGVNIGVRAPNYSYSWVMEFAAAGNVALTPGTYEAATRAAGLSSSSNGLSVSGAGSGCNVSTGRFVVLEIAYRPDGRILRFAADFEQHCEDMGPGLYGAIRYNSTIADANPFAGIYPLYQLSVSAVGDGRVSGGGLQCEAGTPACVLTLAAPARVPLTAEAEPGYLFAGWAGHCAGAAITSVHVNGPKQCSAAFEPRFSSSPRTFLYLHSQPGDGIGPGGDAGYSTASSQWIVTSDSGGNSVHVTVAGAAFYWRIDFSREAGQPLVAGTYGTARGFAGMLAPGLDVRGAGGGCNTATGRFVVLDLALGPNGIVQRFAADFEYHCEDVAPALFGAVRFNSSVSDAVPFGGAYPQPVLTIDTPVNGHVGGSGVDCGPTTPQCEVTLSTANHLTLMATPAPGYTFMGWTSDCSGGATTVLHLNGRKRCTAQFAPLVPTSPRTRLWWEMQAGNPIARREVLSLVNSHWTPKLLDDGNGILFTVENVGPMAVSTTRLQFQAPLGELLQPGRSYRNAKAVSSTAIAGVLLQGDPQSCGGGDFVIRELTLGPGNVVLSFAATFSLRCGAEVGPAVSGTVLYNSTFAVPITTLSVDPSSMRFGALHNRSVVTVVSAPQAVRLMLSRPGVGWNAAGDQPWIKIFPASGTGSASIAIALDMLGSHPAGVNATGKVNVMLEDGSAVSTTIEVNVSLHELGTTAKPFGSFDTPLPDTTGVTGAIPMTGWALDDIEVVGVTICRAPVAPEVTGVNPSCGGAAQIFVGNGVFIEGARPDVRGLFSAFPRSDIGGWGFMLLTNMLPNRGNGTFRFSAYAHDREGFVTLLGTRTMTCDNAHATAPFGAIDTPAQGETVSGSTYINFGWALTPMPKHIPSDGSTMMVYVDGAAAGVPSYNHYRSDIAGLFPGLANSNGAVGFSMLDTTALGNGLHTISWTATDSDGVTSGLGSRFFRVANGTGGAQTPGVISAAAALMASTSAIDTLRNDDTPIVARRGWDLDAPWRRYDGGDSAPTVLRGEELDRFEVALPTFGGETYSGYVRTGGGFAPLPAGSRLDAATGSFSWSPGVGFIGSYDLVFVRSRGTVPRTKRDLRVILQPKGSGHMGTQVVVDTPRPQQDAAQPFALAGWAIDLDAAAGTGVDALHVWAYPLTGGPPIFLGAADYGGSRPDVAAVHGPRFHASGYGLLVQGLTPGNYDLAVFAWSSVSNGFAPAQVVRVTAR